MMFNIPTSTSVDTILIVCFSVCLSLTRSWVAFLYLGVNGQHRSNYTEDQVKADKELIGVAWWILCEVDVQADNASNRDAIHEKREEEKKCSPDLGAWLFHLVHPGAVPGVGKVYQQDQLDKDEHERTNQTKVHHYCELSKNIEKMVSILCIFQHKIMNATIHR